MYSIVTAAGATYFKPFTVEAKGRRAEKLGGSLLVAHGPLTICWIR